MLLGKIICGLYWNNIRGYESRAVCSICKKKNSIEIIENEQHIWLECENNGQAATWEIARTMWERTSRRRPFYGLQRGDLKLQSPGTFNINRRSRREVPHKATFNKVHGSIIFSKVESIDKI